MCCGCLFSFCGIYVPKCIVIYILTVYYNNVRLGTVFSFQSLNVPVKQNGIVYQDTKCIVFNISVYT